MIQLREQPIGFKSRGPKAAYSTKLLHNLHLNCMRAMASYETPYRNLSFATDKLIVHHLKPCRHYVTYNSVNLLLLPVTKGPHIAIYHSIV